MSTPDKELSRPQRGEIWLVELDPVRGSEQAKTRPVVVMSASGVSRPTVRICVPLIGALRAHSRLFWCVPLQPNATNGLGKDSTADAGQVRTLDVVRFIHRLGSLEANQMQDIADAVTLVVGYVPSTPDG